MKHCNNCGMDMRGDRKKCVLCGAVLIDTGPDQDREHGDIFPYIPPAYENNLVLKILIFISVAAAVISFTVQLLFPTAVNWSRYVLLGIASLWVGVIIVLRKRYNIPKAIMWQVTVISLLSLLWDRMTGWNGWSLDYLIPIVYLSAELTMYITAKILHLGVREYINYAMISGLFGIVPIAFILFDIVNAALPSVICSAVSVIFLSAIFIFQGENIIKELKKRMHI